MKRNKAIISSLTGKFTDYEIKDVLTVQYVNKQLIITYLDKDNSVQNGTYSSEDVIIRIA